MNVILRAILSVWQYVLLLVTWILAWVLQIVTIVVTYPFLRVHTRQMVLAKIFRFLNFIVMDVLNPFWTVEVLHGLPASIKSDTKYITMFNHASNADPFLVLRLFVFADRDWKFVTKGSLFSVPFGGWCLRQHGDLEVKFTKEKDGWGTEKGSTKELLERSVAAVDEGGQGIAVFPEGVRNPEPEKGFKEFKAGYFDLAIEHGYKILPVALSGSETSWPVRDWKLDSAHVYMSCGDLIDPAGHTRESLMQLVRDTLGGMRDKHPDVAARNAKAK